MLIFRVSLTQDEGIVEEDNLSIDVFYHDKEGLGGAMNFFVPAEICNYGQVYAEKRPRDRLYLSL
jgi:hypothetical protein